MSTQVDVGFLTTDDLATRWHLKPAAVRAEIRRGRIRATFIGGQWLIKPADAEAFETSRMNVQPAPKRTRRPRARVNR